MRYQWILFDADETLYSFNSYFGLKAVLKSYGIDFTESDYAEFQAVNKPLWVDYQNKKITAEQLRTIRFAKLSALTKQTAEQLNLELMAQMALVSQPLVNVEEMLTRLYGKVKMGIITNGFDALQQQRLANTQTKRFFEFVVTSESVGAAKPDAQIFQSAFAQMGEFTQSKVLMVGDTLASDILGASQVGIDSCWFNPEQKTNDTQIIPTYEIHNILDLVEIASS